MPKGSKAARKRRATVPYARGYKPPSVNKSLKAILDPSKSATPAVPRYLEPHPEFFQLVPHPASVDDWLAQYNESGQSYGEFLRQCPWLSSRKWKQTKQSFNPRGRNIREKYPEGKIYLLPLGEFCPDRGSAPRFGALLEYVQCFYEIPVQVLSGVELQRNEEGIFLTVIGDDGTAKEDCDSERPRKRRSSRTRRHRLEYRHDSRTGHTQLRVSSILGNLKKYVPEDAFFVMSLTMLDLYEDETDLFVAGMAAGNHRVGVFSFRRYDPDATFSCEFWHQVRFRREGLVPEPERTRLILGRSCKLLVHEVAHLLGLDHCIWYRCCMNGSGHLQEDFDQPMFLCPVDLHKLETLCGFDVVDRYWKMLDFFLKYEMEDEADWIRKRLSAITDRKSSRV